MKNTKLHELLINLTPNEFNSLGKFIASPYHNTNEKITSLYNYLSGFSPDYNNEKLNKQNIFKQIYKNEPYKEKRVDLLFSGLKSLIEKLLLNEKISSDTVASKPMLMKILR